MNYRIYRNICGWEYLLTVKKEHLDGAVSCLEEETYIMIIQHNIQDNSDFPYYSGTVVNYFEKEKVKTK